MSSCDWPCEGPSKREEQWCLGVYPCMFRKVRAEKEKEKSSGDVKE